MRAPQAAPTPVLSAFHQFGAQCVALDIAANGVEMTVTLDDEGLESPLIKMTRARCTPMRVPALRVRQGDQAHVIREMTILERPKHQMPMVWHEAPREKTHRNSRSRFGKNSLESEVVLVPVEDPTTRISAIEHVINESAWRST